VTPAALRRSLDAHVFGRGALLVVAGAVGAAAWYALAPGGLAVPSRIRAKLRALGYVQ
jgi:hypothetical protein